MCIGIAPIREILRSFETSIQRGAGDAELTSVKIALSRHIASAADVPEEVLNSSQWRFKQLKFGFVITIGYVANPWQEAHAQRNASPAGAMFWARGFEMNIQIRVDDLRD
jgi:hypothetical protein